MTIIANAANTAAKIDYIEVKRPGVLHVHSRGAVIGKIEIAGDNILLATQSSMRSHIRRGVPVLDEDGWADCPASKGGFLLLNAHDMEFVFRSKSELMQLIGDDALQKL